MKKQHREKIVYMQYRTIEKGFYEISVLGKNKIIAEGNVCGGVLTEMMEKTKQDKGKIIRVRGKEPLWDDEAKEELNKLRSDNKELIKKLKKIEGISQLD